LSKIKLNKYPVITEQNNYMVSIKETNWDGHLFNITIQILNEEKSILHPFKFRTIYNDWKHYEDYKFDLIGLAKGIVKHYEEVLDDFIKENEKDKINQARLQNSINDFKQWDGKTN
jgi:hypothetical protein